MRESNSLLSLTMAVLMVVSVIAVATPTALASHGTGGDVAVDTQEPTDVTESAARLQGNLTHLNASDGQANVSFELWEAGDPANSSTYDAGTLNETGEFRDHATGLDNGTDYAYQAYAAADNTTVNGSVVEFTTAEREVELNVETLDASDVTNDSATLNGLLEGLNESNNASVSFSYWTENDSANATAVDAGMLDEPGEFSASVSGLQNETTYVYTASAVADGVNVSGETVRFTPGSESENEGPTWDGSGPFGQFVSGIVQDFDDEEDEDKPLGQWLSEVVRENNPGQGPPEDAGPDSDDDADANETEDDEPGPPEDVGPDSDEEDDESEDDDGGPPEDAGPPENVTQGPPENVTQGPPENVTQGPPENVTQGPPENVTRGPPENVTRGPPENVTQGPPENVTQGPPGNETDDSESDSDDSDSDNSDSDSDDSDSDDSGPPENAGPPGNETDDSESDSDDSESDSDDSGGPPGNSPGNGPP